MNYLSTEEVRLLLDRDEALGDLGPALAHLAGSSVLVTGAGTLGMAICDHLVGKVRELHCCDHSEVALYRLAREIPGAVGHLCSVDSRQQVADMLEAARPDVVIHTAAHKHVGLVEAMPMAGVGNNVGGMEVLRVALSAMGVQRFVLVSSDKAVAPSCVYGATKHVCERLAYGWGATVLRLVNLLGSSGSVLPTFVERLELGLPLVVTHPEVERYFITVREAARAAIRAASLDPCGNLTTTPCFPPVRIADLAERAGRWCGAKAEIQITDLSPVEKLSEVPLYADEAMEDVGGLLSCVDPHPRFLLADGKAYGNLRKALSGMRSHGAVRAALRALVPDYQEAPQ